jgi:hypothetical protein
VSTVESRSAAATAEPGAGAAPDGDLPGQVGRFQVRGRLGSGAFGAVYRAYDPHLDREVALKLPHPDTLDDAKAVERFLREAKAAARLRHPHIVPVYAAGCDGGRYYLAAAFIDGPTLASASEGGLDCRRAAAVVRGLAEALAYAHDQGIVHRDVKPASVLLDGQGEPHLLDFGLAHRRDDVERLTQAGAVLGTPAYMAPEQAEGSDPAPAGDQYSLGVILYELLCGRTPFSGPAQAVVYQVLHEDPQPPRRVNPRVPPDLEAVCLKALARRPADRYAGCQELADDLRRWLDGESVRARRPGPVERLVRWGRREPALALTAVAAAVCLVAATLVGSASAARFAGLRQRAAEARRQAEEAQRQQTDARARAEQEEAAEREALHGAEQQKNEAEAARALAAREEREALAARQKADEESGKLRDALASLEKTRRAEAEAGQQADQERQRLQARLKEAAELPAQTLRPGAVNDYSNAAVTGDGKYLALGSDTQVTVWDTTTGQEVARLRGHALPVTAVVFSPDGKRVAAASRARSVRVWDVATRKEVVAFGGHTGPVHCLAVSPDGRRFASGGADTGAGDALLVWDASTGEKALSLRGHGGSVSAVAFSPDGSRLASGGKDGAVKVWDTASGQEVRTLSGPGGTVTALAFSPDGTCLAAAGRAVLVWDAATGKQLLEFDGQGSVAFSADGRRLATAHPAGAVIWDAATGEKAIVLGSTSLGVTGVAYFPDGRRLASVSGYGVVRVWDLTPLQKETGAVAPTPDK